MARNRLMRTAVTALVVSTVALLPAGRGAAATCFSDPSVIAAVDVAFVGALSGVSPNGDQATFTVREVWTAENLAAVVVVASDPGWFSGSPPGDYLVLASVIDGTLRLSGSECNVAFPWDASFANLRPATAHPPQSGGDTANAGLPVETILVIGLLVLLVAVSALAFTRRRAPAG